jgi:hypothetical protein
MEDLKTKLHLNFIQDEAIFPVVPEYPISAELRKYLATYLPLALAIDTEKARSEYIVAPILGELKMSHHETISLFSGIEFNVDKEPGLAGRCDYIISNYYIDAPEKIMGILASVASG